VLAFSAGKTAQQRHLRCLVGRCSHLSWLGAVVWSAGSV
jgi:hypothetical protein